MGEHIASLLEQCIQNNSYKAAYNAALARIKESGESYGKSVDSKLNILSGLASSHLGKHLIEHQSLNGYWRHYIESFPRFKRELALPKIENFILACAPRIKACQRRAALTLTSVQAALKDNAHCLSLRAGMMSEFIYLDFSAVKNVRLFGIDDELGMIAGAKTLAELQNIKSKITLIDEDPWGLDEPYAYDVVVLNNLSHEDFSLEKMDEVLTRCAQSLKPGGQLITSIHTPEKKSIWNMNAVIAEDLNLEHLIFDEILACPKPLCFTEGEIAEHLTKAGFSEVSFKADEANINPVVVAKK